MPRTSTFLPEVEAETWTRPTPGELLEEGLPRAGEGAEEIRVAVCREDIAADGEAERALPALGHDGWLLHGDQVAAASRKAAATWSP